jgi:IS30 family transposase
VKTTIFRELHWNALLLGRVFAASAGAYELPRRPEAILEREAALRLFVGDRLAEGWTPEQISGWLKSGNEPRLRAIGCETIYAFTYRTGGRGVGGYVADGLDARAPNLAIEASAPGSGARNAASPRKDATRRC